MLEGKLRFQSLASGSSGNCYYVGNSTCGILVDAGISARNIHKGLQAIGIGFEQIWGIFITHDHTDHVRGVGILGERFNIPIYTTKSVHEGIHRNFCVKPKLYTCRKYIEKFETVELGGFRVTSFPVSHDSTDSVGYTFEYNGKKITFVTDLGYVNDETISHIQQADYLVLESNYDEKMLFEGSYPAHLKRRVSSDRGHLSNDQAGKCLAEHYHDRLQHVFLCHLSKENNLPELAYMTIKHHLETKNILIGKDIEITTLDRYSPSDLFLF